MFVLAQANPGTVPAAYVPVAIGFFGLGTGYFIWGGQALFGFPKNEPGLDQTMAMWLIYLTYGAVFNAALHRHWWV